MADQGALKQIIQKLKDSNNVLVTVNSNPSVDELSAALAITLCINKLNKHATAVFSGDVPPAIEFLNPEKTFENTVDSLRDFIIALDKEKADHLRYKVVDDMVKIFITPYRTTINEKDLEFSQGDYNVEFVLAVGVQNETDLDRALESHGRILHDATVAAVSLGEPTKLGGIEWADSDASSYSEMLFQIAEGVKGDKTLLDEQVATAFLTGIVAATDRFSNGKTSSKVMTVAAQLMSAGANQQLIATKLEEDMAISTQANVSHAPVEEKPQDLPKEEQKDDDGAIGALSISHVPEGDVDEVTKAVATENSGQALSRAEQELAKQTERVNEDRQEDATEEAEQKLAEQLATTAPAAPPAFELPTVTPVAAPLAGDPLKSHTDEETGIPSFGGTLNATTEQAEEDKRQQIEDDRNHTILSHNSSYATGAPSFQSPINAAAGHVDAEPEVRDVLAEGNDTALTSHAEVIQPPAPITSSEPTLAEIDAQNRVAHTDARAALDAALNTQDQPTPAMPAFEPAPIPAPTHEQEVAPALPPLPPLPPMPDFSTLPPLPGEPTPASVASVPDTLGAVLPPAPAEQPAQPADPGQFRIPGQ
ncbi:MAG TPA: hypothetical protein VLH14_00025 [Patescibacteria group bacterium]|nr:hypothetical protein [Patescibacteria group bacterium]